MRKIMLAAMAALAITGCSQNEEFEAASQKAAIGFNTIVSKTTRAAITDLDALKGSGFTVYAYTSATAIANNVFPTDFGTLMTKQAVTHDGTKWNSGEYYWPWEGKVHFYAYATDDTNVGTYTPAAAAIHPKLEYTVAATAGTQKDFVVAKLESTDRNTSTVELPFTHALTQVNFSAVGTNTSLTYTVNSIKISNVAEKGTYNFKDGAWTVASEVASSYDYPIAESERTVSGTTKKDFDATTNTLMLMPQAMNANTKIIISYSVLQGGKIINVINDSEISLKDKLAWESGKKMRYTLSLDAAGVSLAFSDPDVGSWGTPEVSGN